MYLVDRSYSLCTVAYEAKGIQFSVAAYIFLGIELSEAELQKAFKYSGIPVSILVPSQAIIPLWHKDQKVT
ncbi:hypothetical protein FEM48_Zijuj06G0210700 [Ziziphus jujuba var. spinosa]|uniref:Uncharacterized protein n=1 Tax=Ziziphus jujuba var. spinosa TaxID=714518 RepID=A0A978VBL9_ZIZJJ|nr:hypothetical protein FEM48_Zijuj06G0210700 [Ziziphus jujuba var. spinosa]